MCQFDSQSAFISRRCSGVSAELRRLLCAVSNTFPPFARSACVPVSSQSQCVCRVLLPTALRAFFLAGSPDLSTASRHGLLLFQRLPSFPPRGLLRPGHFSPLSPVISTRYIALSRASPSHRQRPPASLYTRQDRGLTGVPKVSFLKLQPPCAQPSSFHLSRTQQVALTSPPSLSPGD